MTRMCIFHFSKVEYKVYYFPKHSDPEQCFNIHINIFLVLLERVDLPCQGTVKENKQKAVLYFLKPYIKKNFIASHMYKFMESE